ncbi:hypothetical protein BESB_054950 [Besnoitia besnoiti]|uniref:Uncharacterized protein n=1 Tax=Besnoitia besnoiti TaxID=94643 RepID=A0A2A9MF66_BESBE|nr:hypothetical protein BESB_054950 [Besnoitia besnoiti]PFH35844.1 hypothetical protein BESB_054950 [Besnoitia besnoiti]
MRLRLLARVLRVDKGTPERARRSGSYLAPQNPLIAAGRVCPLVLNALSLQSSAEFQVLLSKQRGLKKQLDALENEEKGLEPELMAEYKRVLQNFIHENSRCVDLFLDTQAGNRMLRERTSEYVELNPGLDIEQAEREARLDFREVNEVHLSEKLTHTFEEMKKCYRLRYVLGRLNVMYELLKIEEQYRVLVSQGKVHPRQTIRRLQVAPATRRKRRPRKYLQAGENYLQRDRLRPQQPVRRLGQRGASLASGEGTTRSDPNSSGSALKRYSSANGCLIEHSFQRRATLRETARRPPSLLENSATLVLDSAVRGTPCRSEASQIAACSSLLSPLAEGAGASRLPLVPEDTVGAPPGASCELTPHDAATTVCPSSQGNRQASQYNSPSSKDLNKSPRGRMAIASPRSFPGVVSSDEQTDDGHSITHLEDRRHAPSFAYEGGRTCTDERCELPVEDPGGAVRSAEGSQHPAAHVLTSPSSAAPLPRSLLKETNGICPYRGLPRHVAPYELSVKHSTSESNEKAKADGLSSKSRTPSATTGGDCKSADGSIPREHSAGLYYHSDARAEGVCGGASTSQRMAESTVELSRLASVQAPPFGIPQLMIPQFSADQAVLWPSVCGVQVPAAQIRKSATERTAVGRRDSTEIQCIEQVSGVPVYLKDQDQTNDSVILTPALMQCSGAIQATPLRTCPGSPHSRHGVLTTAAGRNVLEDSGGTSSTDHVPTAVGPFQAESNGSCNADAQLGRWLLSSTHGRHHINAKIQMESERGTAEYGTTNPAPQKHESVGYDRTAELVWRVDTSGID